MLMTKTKVWWLDYIKATVCRAQLVITSPVDEAIVKNLGENALLIVDYRLIIGFLVEWMVFGKAPNCHLGRLIA